MAVSKTLLVTGATGKQGRALIDTLLASSSSSSSSTSFNVIALTRKASSSSALALSKRYPSNVRILEGNLSDSRSIFRDAKSLTKDPIWGVFGVTTPMGGKEQEQGIALVDAALEAGAERFVFTSVERGGDHPTEVPHFITKHNIEEHMKKQAAEQGGKMAWTILRPVFFMDNLVPGAVGKIITTAWKISLEKSKKPLQMISVADIGMVAAQAFLKPDEFKNEAISLAGDELTYEQADEIFKSKTGYSMPTTYGPLVSGALWMTKDLRLMFKFFQEHGFGTDVPALKRRFPEIKGFGEWIEKSPWMKN